jgi:hypothetical protein
MQTFATPPIWAKMAVLLDCLRAAMRDLPDPCSLTIQPGQLPAFDFSCEDGCDGNGNGKAWVRLITEYPSTRFPQPLTTATPCSAWEMAYSVEIGIVRCVAIDGTDVITDEQNMEDSLLQSADAHAMYRAVLCCFTGDEEVVMGSYVPYGPQGGVLGGSWTMQVRL